VVEVNVRRDAASESPALATVNVAFFDLSLDPDAFQEPLPAGDAFLHALAYAERAGIACVLIDDPEGNFPPDKRPVRDVSAS